MGVYLASFIVVITAQWTSMSKHQVVHLRYIQFLFVHYSLIKLKKLTQGIFNQHLLIKRHEFFKLYIQNFKGWGPDIGTFKAPGRLECVVRSENHIFTPSSTRLMHLHPSLEGGHSSPPSDGHSRVQKFSLSLAVCQGEQYNLHLGRLVLGPGPGEIGLCTGTWLPWLVSKSAPGSSL